jgi:hypothetical protein
MAISASVAAFSLAQKTSRLTIFSIRLTSISTTLDRISEMKNIYDGVTTLDASGSANVALPDWFEAVNGDFRYQLTAMGAPGPNLHIAQEISNPVSRLRVASQG